MAPRLAVLTLAALASCGRSDAPRRTADRAAVVRESTRTSVAAQQQAETRDEWNVAEVVKRLTEAGLVVTDRKREVRQPYLHVPGTLLDVSGSELQVYIYPNTQARVRDSGALDSTRAAPRGESVSWQEPPHLIASGNLVAIHLTLKDHLAERVSDVLTARHANN